MKKIAVLAIIEIAEKEQLSTTIKPLTYAEYYHSDTFKKRHHLEKKLTRKFSRIISPLFSEGQNTNNNIIIFLDNFYPTSSTDKKHQLIHLLTCALHELGHSHQLQKLPQYSPEEQFFLELEYFINSQNVNHYQKFYAKYLRETLASLYGLTKTEEFLANHHFLYPNDIKYLTSKKEKYQYQYITYDFNLMFQEFHKLQGKGPLDFSLTYAEFLYQSNTNQFKPLSEIINNWPAGYGLNTLYRILSTNEFLNQTDLTTKTNKELAFLQTAINYCYEIELKKKAYTDQLLAQNNQNINPQKILSTKKEIIVQINRLKNTLTLLKLHQYHQKDLTNTKELLTK